MSSEQEIDKAGLDEFMALRDRIAPRWVAGVTEVLQKRNLELLNQIANMEDQIDSLIIITNKPKELKKHWRELLNEYERACNTAIAYASRHLSLA